MSWLQWGEVIIIKEVPRMHGELANHPSLVLLLWFRTLIWLIPTPVNTNYIEIIGACTRPKASVVCTCAIAKGKILMLIRGKSPPCPVHSPLQDTKICLPIKGQWWNWRKCICQPSYMYICIAEIFSDCTCWINFRPRYSNPLSLSIVYAKSCCSNVQLSAVILQ
jgi:hypothetical protein